MPYKDPEKRKAYRKEWYDMYEARPYNPHRWWWGFTYSSDLDIKLRILFERMTELRVSIHEVSRRSGVGVTAIKSWAVGRYKPATDAIYLAVCESVGLIWDYADGYRVVDYFVSGGVHHSVSLPFRPKNAYHRRGLNNR